jgi:hypothetical protein
MRVIIALAVLAVSLSVGGCSRPYQEVYAKPIPSPPQHPTKVKSVKRHPPPARNLPELTKTRSVKPPPLPPRKSAQTRSPIPPSDSTPVPVGPPATAKHYVVVDPVGNCAVVDAKPADGLKIIGEGGYASLEAANQALKEAKCKDVVGGEADAKFKAAKAKAEKLGVDKLTSEDIEGLSQEQLKQLRGY